MKVDTTAPIFELDGTPATTGGVRCPRCGSKVGGEEEPLTLAIVASRALVQDREQIKSDMDKSERAMLALRIFDADGEIDLEAAEIAAVQKYVDAFWTPITVAQAKELLEGRENPFER